MSAPVRIPCWASTSISAAGATTSLPAGLSGPWRSDCSKRTAHSTPDWPWWEDSLTWGNAKLPHAMLVAGSALGRDDMVRSALTAIGWLLKVQTGEAGQLSIIGNQGWFFRGGVRAPFDQQPIEAKGLVQACLAAATITREKQWADQARRCFEWFAGRNDLDLPLYNSETGGCHDGLTPGGVNANQGAESTLAYILSVLELHQYDRTQKAEQNTAQGQYSLRRSASQGSTGRRPLP